MRAKRAYIDTQLYATARIVPWVRYGYGSPKSTEQEITPIKFTESNIRALAGPAGKLTKSGKPVRDAIVFADQPKGLAVRLDATAEADSLEGKSYLIQYRVNGVKRRMPIGACSSISLADAIKTAKGYLGDVSRDRDPFVERQEAKRQQARDAYTFNTLLGDWAELHLKTRRASYAQKAPHVVRQVFKKLLDQPATAIDRRAIVAALDAYAKQAPHVARAAKAYASAAWGWAIARGTLDVNPFLKLPVAETTKRDRVLKNDEIQRVWRATERPGVFNAVVRLLVLTGQRREEVAGMEWSELAPDLSVWTIPGERAKNGKAHVVPLSKQAREMIAVQPRGAALVFPGMRGDSPFNGWSRPKRALDRASSVAGWVLHDLRRTVATNLQKLGVRLEVTEAVLNHVGGSRAGIVGIYQRHEWADEKRVALQAWADRLDAIVEGMVEPSNVVALRG
jgi:integrase